MKVLFDISILGRGHAYTRERTGIFRVIESLAEGLINRPDCDTAFCTNNVWEDIALAKNYISSHPKFSNRPFSEPINYVKRNNLRSKYINLGEKHSDSRNNIPFLKKAVAIIKNQHLGTKEKILSNFKKHLLHSTDLMNADIYHSHFFSSFSGIKKAGVKNLFTTSYDIIPILYPQFCGDGVLELMLRELDKITPETWVLCISKATRNDLLNYMGNKLDPNKVKVTELAASNLFYRSPNREANQSIRARYGIPDTPYILSLCTLEPRKNIDLAVRAFVNLIKQEHINDLNLILVGAKGWKSEKIFESIKVDNAIKDRIYITGYMADEDLSAMYSDAMMFVYPSFYEGFGLPPLEAMQCGVPTITSNTSSLPEVVGDAAIMIDPTDLASLCNAMLAVYSNSELRIQMAQKSLERAKRFSWERCTDETISAYKLATHG